MILGEHLNKEKSHSGEIDSLEWLFCIQQIFYYFNYVFLLQFYLQNVILNLQQVRNSKIQCTQKALPDRHKR